MRTYSGITCTWLANLSEGGAVCHLPTGNGLSTAVAKRVVIVRNHRTGKIVFTRNQPEHSAGTETPNDKRIYHRETHQGIACYWSKVGGGAAFCYRADNHGYSAGLSPVAALVISEDQKVVFLRNHP